MNDIENKPDYAAPIRPRPRWKKRLLVGAVAVVLVASGMFIGGGAVIMRMRRHNFASAIPPQHIGRELYEGVSKHAKLDTGRKEQVKAAIDARVQAMERIRERANDEMRSEFEGLRDDVAKSLQPDDATEWNKRMNRYLDRFASDRRK